MFERGVFQEAEVSLLLGAGSSLGGARPKALVFDETNGEHCLAKFPSIKDQVDVVRIEAATMSLAAKRPNLSRSQETGEIRPRVGGSQGKNDRRRSL